MRQTTFVHGEPKGVGGFTDRQNSDHFQGQVARRIEFVGTADQFLFGQQPCAPCRQYVGGFGGVGRAWRPKSPVFPVH